MLALIRRFLKAGVMIDGQRFNTEDGVPQGASLSPLRANVYLHYVLDQWFEHDVKPRLRGEAFLIRYADDFIVCFELESDARRYQSVLPKRLARFSLSVAEEKTKLIRFGRFARRDSQRLGEGAPSTFDFLGFTHYCGRSRAGRFKLKRKTSTKKLRVKLREMRLWFHHQPSTPTGEMWATLDAKLRGHYQYYGVNNNWPMLMAFRSKVRRMAKRHLSRRSQNSYVNWGQLNRFTDAHPLANPKRLTDLIAMSRKGVVGGGTRNLGAGCINGARPDLRGGELNCARIRSCDTTRGNGWPTGNTNRILNATEFALILRSGGGEVSREIIVNFRRPLIVNVPLSVLTLPIVLVLVLVLSRLRRCSCS